MTFGLSTGVHASVDPILAGAATPSEGGGARPEVDPPRSPAPEAGTATPRLDRGTLLVPGTGEGWAATLYPGAREAVMWRETVPTAPASPAEPEPAGNPRDGDGRLRARVADDPTENRARASRRAKGRVRRYSIANRCTRLATFTYRESPLGSQQVKSDWARFARELKGRYPELAWVRVLELGELHGRLHVHAGLSRFIPKPELARLWGHGFVDVRKLRTKRGGKEDARAAARYLAKYATKAALAEPGEHAYEVAQGHQPEAVRVRGWEPDQLWRQLVGDMDGEVPSYEWSSSSDQFWRGPPVTYLAWP